ncbi:MAG: ABC transporter substrate-binding protein [Hyphomicrobiales bacterium]
MRDLASFAVAASLCATAVVGLSCERASAQQANDFKIGWILPQVGPVAETARNFMDGVEVGLDIINNSGGFGGLKGRIIVCDSQNQEAQAVICAKKLINEDQVNLMLGATGTPQTVAITPTIEAAGIPMFALAGGSVAWVPVKKWIFKTFAGNDDQVPAEHAFLKKKGWLRAALVRDNSVFGNDAANTVHMVAKKFGIEIIAEEVYSPTDTDVTAQITHVRSLNPDVILNMGQNLTTSVMVSKKVVQLGMKTPIITGTNNVVADFPKLVPESMAQTYLAGSKIVVGDLAADDPLYAPITAYLKRYKDMRGSLDKLTANTPQVADALMFVAAVAKNLGGKVLDKAALRDAIEGSQRVAGLQGFWKFSPDNHASDFSDGVMMVQYVDGAWKAAK